MAVTVRLFPQKEEVLASQARAAQMPMELCLAEIVERALDHQHERAVTNLNLQLEIMAAAVAPETTAEQMESALEEALEHVRPRRAWMR